MATKKKPGRDEVKETRAEETQRKWAQIRADAGEGAGTCSVFRLTQGKRDEQLANVSIDDLGEDPYELLRARWGGGEYLVVLRTEAGTFVEGARVRYHLSGSPKDPDKVQKDSEFRDLEKRLEKLSDGSKDSAIMVELIRSNAKREPPPPPVDYAPLVTAVGLVLAPVLTALLKRPELPAPLPPPPTALEQIETLGAVMALAREMNPPADGIAGLAKTMGEPIARLVDAHLANQGATAPGRGAPPQKPNAGADVARPEWYAFLAPIVPQAMRWAEAGKDAEFRGDFIVDELRDDQLGPVFRVLSSPTFREEFFREFPEAQAHTAWFDVLFRRIAGGIMDPDEVDAAEKLAAEAEGAVLPELEPGTEEPETPGTEEPETPVAGEPPADDVGDAEARSLG